MEQKNEAGSPYHQHFRYRMRKIYDEAAWSENIATVSNLRLCQVNSDLTEPLITMHQGMAARGFVFHTAPEGFTSFSYPGANEETWNEIMFALQDDGDSDE